MTEQVVAFSADRRKRLVVVRRPDGLHVLHDQRLIDPDAIPELEYGLVELPFPENHEPIPSRLHVLDMPLAEGLYGSEADAEREALSIARQA